MTSYYILKPVRDSLFLGQAGYTNLPVAHLIVVVVVYTAYQVYEAAARRYTRSRLVFLANGSFVVAVLAFWLCLGPLGRLLGEWAGWAWVFYCWVSVFVVFAVSLFWSFTHTQFSPDEGRRFYGYIGAGGTIGAMVGSLFTSGMAQELGTVNLLLASAVTLIPCVWIGYALDPRADPGETSSPEEHPVARASGWGLICKSPYLRGIAWIVLVAVCVAGFDDYRYKEVIERSLPVLDERTAFFARAYLATNIVGLFIGLVLTRPLHVRFGPRPGLLAYPLLILIGGVVLLRTASLELVFWLIVLQQAASYSIFKTSRELLFLPRTAEEKFVVKGFVGTFVFRAGTGLASVFILYCWPPDGVSRISYLTIPLALLLAWIGWRLSDGFERLQMEGSSED